MRTLTLADLDAVYRLVERYRAPQVPDECRCAHFALIQELVHYEAEHRGEGHCRTPAELRAYLGDISLSPVASKLLHNYVTLLVGLGYPLDRPFAVDSEWRPVKKVLGRLVAGKGNSRKLYYLTPMSIEIDISSLLEDVTVGAHVKIVISERIDD